MRLVPPLGTGRSPTDEFKQEQRMTQFILRPLRLIIRILFSYLHKIMDIANHKFTGILQLRKSFFS